MGLIRNIKRWINKKANDPKYQYDVINVDISGVCNARCSYCPTGVGKHSPANKFMTAELFEKIIKHLIKIKVIGSDVNIIDLYSWGEPFINPDFDKILSILAKYNLKAGISSNFIKFPEIKDENYKNIGMVTFSICSFDKENYRKIYKADIDKVLDNYSRFVEKKEEFNPTMGLRVNWLRYNFNANEYEKAENYFKNKKAEISDRLYAMMADRDVWFDIIQEKALERHTQYYNLEEVYQDIDFEREQRIFKCFSPEEDKISDCRQMKILTIGEAGQLVGCCGLYSKYKEYDLGNFLEMDKKKVYQLKHTMKVCVQCCKLKAAWYGHNFWRYSNADIEQAESAV